MGLDEWQLIIFLPYGTLKNPLDAWTRQKKISTQILFTHSLSTSFLNAKVLRKARWPEGTILTGIFEKEQFFLIRKFMVTSSRTIAYRSSERMRSIPVGVYFDIYLPVFIYVRPVFVQRVFVKSFSSNPFRLILLGQVRLG